MTISPFRRASHRAVIRLAPDLQKAFDVPVCGLICFLPVTSFTLPVRGLRDSPVRPRLKVARRGTKSAFGQRCYVRVAEESSERKFEGWSVSLKPEMKTTRNLFELLVTPTVLLVDNELQQLELDARPKEVDGNSGRCR